MVRFTRFALGLTFLVVLGCTTKCSVPVEETEPAPPGPYTIKIKQRGQSDLVRVEETQTRQEHFKAVDDEGTVHHDKTLKVTESSVFRETVLEKDGLKRTARIKRDYEKAQGQKTDGGATEKLPYDGKSVLIEAKAGKYEFHLEDGQELSGEDAYFLDKEFNKGGFDINNWLFPNKTVAVDESWNIDVEAFIKILDKSHQMGLDIARAKGTGKLLRVYKKGNHLYGVFEHQVTFPFKEGEIMGGEVLAGSKITAHWVTDICIHGGVLDSSGKRSLELSATAIGPLPDVNKPVKGTMSNRNTNEWKIKELPTN